MKYRTKPVIKEAFLWTGDESLKGAPRWIVEAIEKGVAKISIAACAYFIIKTREGEMRADPGDYIIRGIQGELYPCKPEIFVRTYEPAE